MRPWTKRAVIAAVALAAAAGAWRGPAMAQAPIPIAPPAPPGTAAPIPEATPESAAAPATQVLQAPSRVGQRELRQLAAILASANGASVVLRVPGSATIEASEPDLRALAAAAGGARFLVVQQDDARLDGAAAILSAFADQGFRQPGSGEASGEPGELWPVVARMTACSRPCPPSRPTSEAPLWMDGDAPTIEADLAASERPLAEVLDEAAPDDGGGGVEPLMVGLLILVAGGLTFVALARARRRRETETSRRVAANTPARPATGALAHARPAPTGDPGPPAPALPARTGRARQAKVISVLDPEGYVEFDRCLQRARWASPGALPATPGEWVDVETHGRRLWAYAAARPPAPAGRPRRPRERRHSREPL
jgi:hypothetical protein